MGFNEATWWSAESTGDIISVRLSWSPINSWGFILSPPIQIYIYGGFLLGKYRGEIHHFSACHRLPMICWSNPITYGFRSRCIAVLALHQPPAGACLCSAHWLRRFTATSTQKCPFHTVAAYTSTLALWPREGTALALPMASPVTWAHSWDVSLRLRWRSWKATPATSICYMPFIPMKSPLCWLNHNFFIKHKLYPYYIHKGHACHV
jgi:hypothetical protein